MTEKQRLALSSLVFNGGRMGSNDWHGHHAIHRRTTDSLIRRGWTIWRHGEGVSITDEGRKALQRKRQE